MSDTALEVRFTCDACDGEGWVLAPVQCYDEPNYMPCPLCKGMGVRYKRIYPEVDWEDMRDFTDDDYDPFGLDA
ncbi:MAG: hypothetical protein KatS3mg023_3911 [Armatimonadota bacterium]|nr:MAG: hypothetical protein KatS3mg023_3911 [Armatimonadota bacterium]